MELPIKKLTYDVPEMDPRGRLREMILYIAASSESDPKFGKTKLVKLLYLSDFSSFREFGRPVTGHRYVRMQNGPYPDQFEQLLDEMVKSGEIDIDQINYWGYPNPQHRIKAKRPPNLDKFSSWDIANVDANMRQYMNYSGNDLAKMTHGSAYYIAESGAPIPYESSFIIDEPVTQDDIETIDGLVAKYGVNP